MSKLMSDVIEGRIGPDVCNALCNTGGKLLKIVEMEYKYGARRVDGSGGRRTLELVTTVPAIPVTSSLPA